jgi:hypothetical protein
MRTQLTLSLLWIWHFCCMRMLTGSPVWIIMLIYVYTQMSEARI